MQQQITFEPWFDIRRSEIILVGCGGTGSEIARVLARMLHHLRDCNLALPLRVVFVDPDRVELKNIGRQGFIHADVGQYKAAVLARRLGYALGLRIEFYPEPFDQYKHIADHHNHIVLLGAVDGHEGRRAMSAVSNAIWIDAGNSLDTGQVIIGDASSAMAIPVLHTNNQQAIPIRSLPNAARLFPELLEPDQHATRELSCAELLALNEQHLLINQQMALIVGQYLFKLLMRQPITSHMTYVDVDTLTMRSVPITRDVLAGKEQL